MPPIALDRVEKGFFGAPVLRGLSFEVLAGECVMLVGENGAGKSTLKNLICGLLQPDAGAILIDGTPRHLTSQREAKSLGIATIHQELSLYPNLSVAENIGLGLESRRIGIVSWSRWRDNALDLLRTQLGSDIDPDQRVGDLSIGQRQLVEIAKALALKPRILILDEPTTCLTLPERDRLMDIVRRLRVQGMAILYITHFMDEVYALADRIVVLRDGAVVGNGTPAEITRQRLGHLMAGRPVRETISRLPPIAPDAKVRLGVKNLGDAALLSSINFDLRAGEILGLAGLVGSGRSEIAEAIVGLRTRTSGQITLDGSDIEIRSPREALSRGIVLVSEDRRKDQAFLDRPVFENATAPFLRNLSGVLGLLGSRLETRAANDLIERYNVNTPGLHAAMATLSGGNQQKLIIGRWLSTLPLVCILDEPTKGVDIGARERIHNLIADLAAKGLAVLLISSDLPELMALSHRLLVMHKGRIAGEALPDEIEPGVLIEMASSGLDPRLRTGKP